MQLKSSVSTYITRFKLQMKSPLYLGMGNAVNGSLNIALTFACAANAFLRRTAISVICCLSISSTASAVE